MAKPIFDSDNYFESQNWDINTLSSHNESMNTLLNLPPKKSTRSKEMMDWSCFACGNRFEKAQVLINRYAKKAICKPCFSIHFRCECGEPLPEDLWLGGSDSRTCQECVPPTERLSVNHQIEIQPVKNILGSRQRIWNSILEQTPNPSSSASLLEELEAPTE